MHYPSNLYPKNAATQARELADLIVGRLAELPESAIGEANPPVAQHRLSRRPLTRAEAETFVRSRFSVRMAADLRTGPLHSFFYVLSNLVAVAGGSATAALAATGYSHSPAVLVIGIAVAISAGFSQLFRFGERSRVRYRAGNQLRQEGWDYVMGRGRYRETDDPREAFRKFYDVFWEIEAPVDRSVEHQEGSDLDGGPPQERGVKLPQN